jgi:hypothetical protein
VNGPTDPEATPADIEALASDRASARAARDFARADELKASIEAAGWKVVDDGPRYTLTPAHPPDLLADGRVVYGSANSVPSRLGDPTRGLASAIVLVGDRLEETLSTVRAIAASTGSDVDVVLVVADGAVARAAIMDGLAEATGSPAVDVGGGDEQASGRLVEVLWTGDSMSLGGSLEAGVRRASGAIVALIEAGAVLEGDPVSAIEEALGDPTVAVVGSEGLASADLHRFERSAPEGPVTALGPTIVALRRADAGRIEGVDPRLTSYAGVIAWVSLALREAGASGEVRRAVALDLPVRARPIEGGDERGALVQRRDRYRIAARFGEDPELTS